MHLVGGFCSNGWRVPQQIVLFFFLVSSEILSLFSGRQSNCHSDSFMSIYGTSSKNSQRRIAIKIRARFSHKLGFASHKARQGRSSPFAARHDHPRYKVQDPKISSKHHWIPIWPYGIVEPDLNYVYLCIKWPALYSLSNKHMFFCKTYLRKQLLS